jgi:hypothetical protein
MRRGPVIHGVLLVAALVFAYQTWTREQVVAPLTGDVVVWSLPPASIKAIMLESEGRVIRVERRSDAQGPYLWGSDTRTMEQYQTRAKDAPDASPTDERPFAPEIVSSTREFMVSEKGEALFANLSELRALRAMGKIDEDKHELYELHEKTQTISVIHDGGTRSLRVGGKIFGGTDRYALDPSTGEGYVISQVVTRDLSNGEAGLRLSKIHDYADDEVGKAVIELKGQKRTMLRTTAVDDKGREVRTWADAQTPREPDQTMANFLHNIDVLRPARFIPDADVSKLELVVRVEYQTRVGTPLGWVELYRQPVAAGAAPGDTGAQPTGQTPGAPAAPGAGTPGQPAAPGAAGTPGQPAAPAAAGAPGQPAPPAAPGQRPAPGRQAASGQPSAQEQDRRPAYLMLTEVTRVLAGVPHNTATRIVADIEQIFGQ